MRTLSVIFFLLIIHFAVCAQCVNDAYFGYGGTYKDEGHAIIADSMQNVYLTGVFTDSIQLGGFSLTTDSIGQFLCKMSPVGTILWAKTLFNNDNDYFTFFPPILKIDHSGQLVMAGTCQNLNTNFDTLTSAFSHGDLFIARFDTATGAINNFISTGRHIYAYIYDMDIDDSSNVYLAGSFVGVINFGGISMTCVGQTNSFVAKFNSQNQAQWARRIITNPNTTGNVIYSLDFDNFNHILVSGWFGLNANFGNGVVLNSPVYSNGFLAKYDLSGNIEWADQSDTSTTFNHQVVMDANSIFVIQNSPAKLIHFDQNGDTVWTKSISNNTYSLFTDFEKYNNKYFGLGSFSNSIFLDGTTYSSAGNNFYLACFNMGGNIDWVRIIPCLNVYPMEMSFDQLDNIYLVGEYGQNNNINQTTILPAFGNTDVFYAKLCEGATSVAEITQLEQMQLYPNPVNSYITIQLNKNRNLQVFNSIGEIVIEKIFTRDIEEIIQLDVTSLSPGIYFLKLNNEVRKFIKL